MPRYEVEFASFHKVIIEADTEAQANDKADVMEDEDIEHDSFETTGYMIWNEKVRLGNMNDDVEIRNENEYYRMKAAELEKAESAINKVKAIIDNDKQRYADIVWSNPDDAVRIVAQNKWKALDDLQKELDQMQI